MLDQATINTFARRLLGAAPAGSEVILFGSYARGEATSNSDLDFLVIEPVVADRISEAVRLRSSLRGSRVGIDILVTSRRVFDEWKTTPNNILPYAGKEGRVCPEMD